MGLTQATPSRRLSASCAPPQQAAIPYGQVPLMPTITRVPSGAAAAAAWGAAAASYAPYATSCGRGVTAACARAGSACIWTIQASEGTPAAFTVNSMYGPGGQRLGEAGAVTRSFPATTWKLKTLMR